VSGRIYKYGSFTDVITFWSLCLYNLTNTKIHFIEKQWFKLKSRFAKVVPTNRRRLQNQRDNAQCKYINVSLIKCIIYQYANSDCERAR